MTYCFAILNVNIYILNQIVSLEIHGNFYNQSSIQLTMQLYKSAQAILNDTSVVFIGEMVVIQ